MHPCSRCHRHVLVSASECPFCGSPQRDTGTSLGGFAGVLLGLALAGCGDDTTPDPTGASSTMTTSPEPTAGDSTTGGTNVTTEVEGGEAADYGGSGPIEDSGLETTPVESSSGEDSSSSGDSSGTDTGATTTDTGSAESADYGGAAPRN